MSDRFYPQLIELLVEYIGPQARTIECLSSGEQRVARRMNEYFWLMVEQKRLVGSSCETVWKLCEPEFREYLKGSWRSEPQNSCVLHPRTFTPMKSDPINNPALDVDRLDDKLVELIKDAVNKTQEIVSKQEWLNPGRMPRSNKVGHFVTTLRRSLTLFIATIPDEVRDTHSYFKLKDFLSKLLNTDNWEDVGFVKLHGNWSSIWNFSCYNGRVWKMDGNKMADLCKRAGELHYEEEASKEIESTLAELQREMYPLKSHVEKMQRINRESEQIIGNLCAIVENR